MEVVVNVEHKNYFMGLKLTSPDVEVGNVAIVASEFEEEGLQMSYASTA